MAATPRLPLARRRGRDDRGAASATAASSTASMPRSPAGADARLLARPYRVRYDFRALAALAGRVAGHAARARTIGMVSRFRRAGREQRRAARSSRRSPPARRRRRAGAEPDGLSSDAGLPRRPGRADCTVVDPRRGFVIIKDDDPEKPLAWLIVPATRRDRHREPGGLPAAGGGLLALRLAGRAGAVPAPPGGLGLAINSKAGRSQNLLHIHISCVLPAVRDALAAARSGPTGRRRRSSPSAATPTTPARWLARPQPVPAPARAARRARGMGEQSLAVIGSADGGFFLADRLDRARVVAEAEALLDETC